MTDADPVDDADTRLDGEVDGVTVTRGVRVSAGVAVTAALRLVEGVMRAEYVSLTHALADAVSAADADAHADTAADAVPASFVTVGATVGEGESRDDAVNDTGGVAVPTPDGDGVDETDAVDATVTLGLPELLGDTVAEPHTLGVADARRETEGAPDTEGDGVGLEDRAAESDGRGEEDSSAVREGSADPLSSTDTLATPLDVALGAVENDTDVQALALRDGGPAVTVAGTDGLNVRGGDGVVVPHAETAGEREPVRDATAERESDVLPLDERVSWGVCEASVDADAGVDADTVADDGGDAVNEPLVVGERVSVTVAVSGTVALADPEDVTADERVAPLLGDAVVEGDTSALTVTVGHVVPLVDALDDELNDAATVALAAPLSERDGVHDAVAVRQCDGENDQHAETLGEPVGERLVEAERDADGQPEGVGLPVLVRVEVCVVDPHDDADGDALVRDDADPGRLTEAAAESLGCPDHVGEVERDARIVADRLLEPHADGEPLGAREADDDAESDGLPEPLTERRDDPVTD